MSEPLGGQSSKNNARHFIIILHAFIMHAHSVVVLNKRCWQSLVGQHGKAVHGLFEKVSFRTAFEGVESG